MSTHIRPSAAQTAPRAAFPYAAAVSLVGKQIADWLAAAADYYAAAGAYEQLSGLSDAELHRRGLSRATLAWDIAQACDRTNAA